MSGLNQPKTLLIMAGGTGGHIFPALAVAQALRERGWRIVWLGNPDGMEARLVPQHGIEMAWVKFAAVRGKGWLRKLLLPINLFKAFVQAAQALRQVKPNAVLGMGGYITFPGGVMARLLGYPLVVHEQNAVAGMANKVLSRIANLTLSGFPSVLPGTQWVGNPVRAEISAVASPDVRFAERGTDQKLRLLVVGGSLGAAALNEVVPKGLALLPESQRPEVIHQAGEKQLACLQANYAAAGVAAQCVPFIADMAAAYAEADWVICRAGALTVAELAAVGAASVLVPFPFAVDDHQTANAGFLSDSGAGIRIQQPVFTPERVAELAQKSRAEWRELAVKARERGKPEATATVADAIEHIQR